MIDLKTRWEALWDNASADDAAQDTPAQVTPSTIPPIDSVPVQDTAEVPGVADELPIHEATPAQLDYWHAWGIPGLLKPLFREYALDDSSANVAAYNHFKIGLNAARHEVTFAIDDTHYLAIPLTEKNSAPLDDTKARRVLEKISRLRESRRRFENFCGFAIECFD